MANDLPSALEGVEGEWSALEMHSEAGERPTVDTGLVCLVMMARILEKQVDARQLSHEMGRNSQNFDETDILQAAKSVGIRAKTFSSEWKQLATTPLPAIARRKNGTFFIIAKVTQGKVLIQDPEAGRPVSVERTAFEEMWDQTLILMTTRRKLVGNRRWFGVSWFIPAFVKYRRILGEVLVASFFLQVLGLVFPLSLMVIVDKAMFRQDLNVLNILVFTLLAVAVFEVLINGLRSYVFSHTTNRIGVELGSSMYKHLLHLPFAYFQGRRIGYTIVRLRELEAIRNFLTGPALTLVVDLAFVFVFLAVMFVLSPLLALIVLGSIPFYAVLLMLVTPIARNRAKEQSKYSAENQDFLVDSISGIETLKGSAIEPIMQRRWDEKLADFVQVSFKVSNLTNISGQVFQLIQKITLVLVLWFGTGIMMAGDITVGQLVAFILLSGLVSQPLLRLARLWQDFQKVRVSIDGVGDILNTMTEDFDQPKGARQPTLRGDVEFENVCFRYLNNGPRILNELSLKVPAGQMLGVVGPSGAGKSTLTKLVQRLYFPKTGRLLIDNADLRLADPAWLRRQVSVVMQESYLFNLSIRDNIALVDPGVSIQRVIKAATMADAHDFIMALPEGYDTIVDERGGSLSVGQRQRIAIARAFLTNPRILIFDEAMSALDYESERIIQRNLRKIASRCTVLIITQRVSALRDCSRIITIEAGVVTEDGAHAELLKSGGYYAGLWQAQQNLSPNVRNKRPPNLGLQTYYPLPISAKKGKKKS